jgi:hypothetical protein
MMDMDMGIIESLIARNAPRLMRQGTGSPTRRGPQRTPDEVGPSLYVTPEMKADFFNMRATGYTTTEISSKHRCPESTVRTYFRKEDAKNTNKENRGLPEGAVEARLSTQ